MTEPRPIRWGRMAALQCGAACVAMAGYFVIPPGLHHTTDLKASVMFMGIFTVPMLMFAALPPYVVAVGTWWLAIAFGRGPVREVLAVATGAVIGSLVPLFLLRSALWQWPAVMFALWLSIAVCSALGFAGWVAAAWRPARAHPEHSLN